MGIFYNYVTLNIRNSEGFIENVVRVELIENKSLYGKLKIRGKGCVFPTEIKIDPNSFKKINKKEYTADKIIETIYAR